jgi:hypothetical protein
LTGVLWIPCLLASTALSFPSRSAVERECVAASVHAHRAVCAVSDLNGDHQADYALSLDIAGSAARPAAISIQLSGAPGPYQLLLPEGVVAASFVLLDVNGDGQPDIALLGGLNETVGVFINVGSGRFQFDRQGRYLTAPSRDCSEMSLPPQPWLCDCAEPTSGSHCELCPGDCGVHKLPTASARLAGNRSTPARLPRGVARSRAP